MKTSQSAMWKWCAGLALALGLSMAAPQAEAAYTGSGTFNLVTSTADITSGGYYVFVGGASANAMASSALATASTAAQSAEAVTTTGGVITDPAVGRVWRVDSASGNWSIYNEAGSIYIGQAGSANNGLVRSAANSSTVFHWTFATTASSRFTIQNATTARILMYNSSSPRFAAYSGGQQAIMLYKLASGASAPSVTTVAASATNATTATVNGNVTSDGGATVTERGACYKTSAGVAITDNKTAAAAGGTGTYSVDLSSLSVNQIYYFKAYAINSAGTTLSATELNFTTLANVPSAPTVENPTSSSLDITVNENGNPASTEFAIQRTSDSKYLQTDGSWGNTAVWATKATWGTKTATGLAESTEYFFQVKARNGVNVETAFGSTGSGTTSAAATGIWINPMSAGTPMGSYYLGDTLGEWFVNFEIGQTWWNYAQVGIGTSAEGTGYSWGEAAWYQDGDGDNKRVHRNLSGFQFTSAANYYVICQAKAYEGDTYTSKSGAGWGDSQAYPPADLASAYFAVSAINDPSDQSATADQSSQINLFWSRNAQSHDVMVVRKLAASSWTEPTQGQSYSASDTIGAGTVIYNGDSEVFYDTGLSASTTYTYKFYSVNNDYYSAGVTAEETTLACEPDAPTGLYASDTNENSFTAAWTASDRATGYRLDVSTEEQFGVASPAADLFISEYIEGLSNNKAVEIFNGTASAVNLSSAGYTLRVYANGGTSPTTITLSGTLAAGAVFVVANPSANAAILAQADMTSGSLTHNGNDQIALAKNSVNIDVIGTIGVNVTNLIDVTKVRKSDVSQGVTTYDVAEWTDYAVDTTSYLGSHDFNSLTPSFVSGYENLAVAGTSQLVEGLSQNTTYYFRVRAEGEGGCPSVDSATASVTTEQGIQDQTIDFPAIGDKVVTDVVELSATASSGLPVSFSVLSGPAEIDGDGVTMTFTGFGEVSVVASQAGNGSYNPAPDVTNTFNVTKVFATVTLNDLAQAYDGTARVVTATTDPEGLTVDITYDGSATAPTAPGSYEVIGTVVDDMYQGAKTNTLVVSVADPASFSATSAGVSSIDLAFAANGQGNDVVIVANGTGTFSAPSGTPVLGGSLGGGTVVYVGTSSPQTHSGLTPCTPYFYKAWSHVDGYYSAGLADSDTTAAPSAPTGLGAVPGYTDFTASWDASAGATGYRLDVSTSPTFTAGDTETTIFTETMGTVGGTTTIAAHETANGFDNDGYTMSGGGAANPGDVRATTPSSNYPSASGLGNIWLSSTSGDYGFGIAGIDASGYSHQLLSFSFYKTGSSANPTFSVQWSTNAGAAWNTITLSNLPAANAIADWYRVSDLYLPPEASSANLSLRWVKTGTVGMRLDDVQLKGYAPAPSYVSGYENLEVAGTSQAVTGLTEATTYYFRVRAEGGCTSANSTTANTTTLEHLRLVLSRNSLNVREAGEGRFFVRLNKNPGGTGVVSVARTSGSDSIAIASGASLTFKPSNWASWQAVTLVQADDGNTVGETATFQVSMTGVDTETVEATALDDDIADNVALASSGTTISGYRAYILPQVIDGVHNVQGNYGWMSWTNPPKGTMTLDIRGLATVSRIRMLNWDWTYRVHRYKIESSQNGTSWTTLVDATGEDHQGWDDWEINNEAIRYLRISDPSNSAYTGFCVSEFEVYGTRPPKPQPEFLKAGVNVREGGEGRFFVRLSAEPAADVVASVARISGDENISVQGEATVTFKASAWDVWQPVTLVAGQDANSDNETATFQLSGTGMSVGEIVATALDDDIAENLALASGGATVSGLRAYRLADVNDGVHNASTNYAWLSWTNDPLGTLTMDLHAVSTVSRIRMLNWDWTCRTHRYKIESSLNGTSWTTLVDASAEDHQGWDDWAVADESIRYLRLTGLTNTADTGFCVSELEVYGERVLTEHLEFSKADVNVREDGEGRIYVRMTSAPAANVAYIVSLDSGDPSITVQGSDTLTFKPSNWNVWQPLTFVAPADENDVGETATFRLAADGVADQFVTATALDDDIAENLARTGGTTISGYRSYTLPLAIDGIHNAKANYAYVMWTGTSKGTMTMDLKAVATVSRIRLLNWDWTYRNHGYKIESSQNGTAWTTLVDVSTGGRQGWDDWAVADEQIRYLRITGFTNSVDNAICIPEWEVYGTRSVGKQSLAAAAAKPGASASAGTVVAESEPVSVLTSEGAADETGWNAVDGDDATAWVGQKAGGGYLVVEYAPALTLSGLEVDLAEGSLADVQGLYSLDAKDWQPLPEDLEKNPVSLNFLWLTFSDDGTAAVPNVIEIRPNP